MIRGIVFFVLPSLAPLLLIIFLALISSYIAEVIKIGLFATTSQLGFMCCLLPLAGFIVCQSSSGILNSHLPKRFMDDHKTSVIMSSFSYRDERFAIKLAELIFFYGSKHKSFLVRVGGTMKGAFALMMIGEMCLLADGLLGAER